MKNLRTLQLNKGSDNIALYGGAKLTYGPFNLVFPVPFSYVNENPAYQNVSILAGVTKHDGSFLFTSTKVSLIYAENINNFLSAFFDALTPEEISNHEYISNNLVERLNRFLGKKM